VAGTERGTGGGEAVGIKKVKGEILVSCLGFSTLPESKRQDAAQKERARGGKKGEFP